MLVSLCGPKTSADANGLILFKFSQNFYYRPEPVFKNFKNQHMFCPKSVRFLKVVVFIFNRDVDPSMRPLESGFEETTNAPQYAF